MASNADIYLSGIEPKVKVHLIPLTFAHSCSPHGLVIILPARSFSAPIRPRMPHNSAVNTVISAPCVGWTEARQDARTQRVAFFLERLLQCVDRVCFANRRRSHRARTLRNRLWCVKCKYLRTPLSTPTDVFICVARTGSSDGVLWYP